MRNNYLGKIGKLNDAQASSGLGVWDLASSVVRKVQPSALPKRLNVLQDGNVIGAKGDRKLAKRLHRVGVTPTVEFETPFAINKPGQPMSKGNAVYV